MFLWGSVTSAAASTQAATRNYDGNIGGYLQEPHYLLHSIEVFVSATTLTDVLKSSWSTFGWNLDFFYQPLGEAKFGVRICFGSAGTHAA